MMLRSIMYSCILDITKQDVSVVCAIDQMSRRNGAHSLLLISIAAFVSVHSVFCEGQGVNVLFLYPRMLFFTLSHRDDRGWK